jgi:kynureninase
MKFKSNDLSVARDLDKEDDLSRFRDAFYMPDASMIYLNGNSLGRLPLAAIHRINQVVRDEWGDRLIRSWNEGWMEASERIGGKLAVLIGARADEVIVSDATSLDLFKLSLAALKFNAGRMKIVSDELNFPSDLYVLQGIVEMFGNKHEISMVPSRDGMVTEPDAIAALLDEDTALLALTHTCFKSAFVYDMKRLTRYAHEKGAMVLWDLSHSVGAVEIGLNECDVDLAVGCTYKYLNGGPGAPAFLFVRKDLQETLMQPIWGWLGGNDPFAFNPAYIPAEGIRRFQVGTPPVLSLLAMEPGLDLHLEAGMNNLRKKSVHMTEYLVYLFDQWLEPLGFELGTPRNPDIRGSHVSIKHPEAYRINRAMIEAELPAVKVIPDFRTPDNLRLGIAPLYNTFEEIFLAVRRIKEIVECREYEQFSGERSMVT